MIIQTIGDCKCIVYGILTFGLYCVNQFKMKPKGFTKIFSFLNSKVRTFIAISPDCNLHEVTYFV